MITVKTCWMVIARIIAVVNMVAFAFLAFVSGALAAMMFSGGPEGRCSTHDKFVWGFTLSFLAVICVTGCVVYSLAVYRSFSSIKSPFFCWTLRLGPVILVGLYYLCATCNFVPKVW